MRSKHLVLAVAGLVLVSILVGVRHTVFSNLQHSSSNSPMKYDLRTGRGVPLASIFEGVPASRFDATEVKRLLSPANLALPDRCTKKAKSSWSKVWDVLSADSVLAQGPCESLCTSHFNRDFLVPGSDCEGIIVCAPGGPWENGCEGFLYECPNGGSACAQGTCSNP